MSDGYRNGAFALGLVTGLGLTLNLVLWLDLGTQQPRNQATNTDSDEGYSQIGQGWDWLIGTFVSPSDTLAQWIMAVFTIAVVILVWRTLVATQQMASDTRIMAIDARRIGEVQTRAYVSVEAAFGKQIPDHSGTRIVVTIRNSGNTPALGMETLIISRAIANYSEKRISFREMKSGTIRTDFGAGETRTLTSDVPDWPFEVSEWVTEKTGQRIFCFVYVTYFDVFDRRRQNMRRTIVSMFQNNRDAVNQNLIMSACERGNRST